MRTKDNNENSKQKNNKKFSLLILLIVTISCIVILEILAFKTNPDRIISDLYKDIVAAVIGLIIGFLIAIIKGYIYYEYKLAIVFGFLFLGISLVFNSALRFGVNLFLSVETYYGLLICILSILSLSYMHEEVKKHREKGRPEISDSIRCENLVSKIIEYMLQGEENELSCFRTYGNEIEIRKILRLVLQFYESTPGAIKLPPDIYYDHGDETGGEILSDNTVTKIFLLLSHRGLLWEDPHNDKKYLTPYGEMIIRYLQEGE